MATGRKCHDCIDGFHLEQVHAGWPRPHDLIGKWHQNSGSTQFHMNFSSPLLVPNHLFLTLSAFCPILLWTLHVSPAQSLGLLLFK